MIERSLSYPEQCLRTHYTAALQFPHLHHQPAVSYLAPDHIGHGQLFLIAPLRALCLLTQLVPLDKNLGIKDPPLDPALLTQCGNIQQSNALRLVHSSLLKMI
jgi:hypothetical protein